MMAPQETGDRAWRVRAVAATLFLAMACVALLGAGESFLVSQWSGSARDAAVLYAASVSLQACRI